MYMPQKPNKYGIKIFSLDSKTYTNHMEIYAGVHPDGPYKKDNSIYAITERMCSHLSGSRRNIMLDCWFTGYQNYKNITNLQTDSCGHN